MAIPSSKEIKDLANKENGEDQDKYVMQQGSDDAYRSIKHANLGNPQNAQVILGARVFGG